MKKAKRIKLKFFKSENEARDYIKHRKKNFPHRKGYSYLYNVLMYAHKKSDNKKWLAYYLKRKIKGR